MNRGINPSRIVLIENIYYQVCEYNEQNIRKSLVNKIEQPEQRGTLGVSQNTNVSFKTTKLFLFYFKSTQIEREREKELIIYVVITLLKIECYTYVINY